VVLARYKGKDNHILRIFVAYRPNPPQGPFTVYAQHNAFFHSIARDICPRRAFLVDLCEAISIAMEAGNYVVLLIDGNSDMKRSVLSKALQQISLREITLGNNFPHIVVIFPI
jgi:23S rRNA pseudoU1915 N3-methylase RlmH